ncbi:DUF4270 family protein [Frigoriflavimonas asaccharolytica]|uniref:DUF4270 family protein n=1 Tax=Frigoriflavimonas asaccharolytica TaxID=2735899 RepID=A0A8J8K510_9FLAO|nr:DUF4270 family protein [Frigoriflavimonas asaccharolytica]NRS92325.1 hypothetical protein [Frigoriflavimonas asaccharolytica]
MIKDFKKIIYIASIIFCGSLFLYNCESDADNLGEQLFAGEGSNANVELFDVIAYNIDNNDSIRSDASQLGFAQIGAFAEGVFGTQKAAYTTQLRMQEYSPTFGTNAIVDSVVLDFQMPIGLYASDSLTTTTTSITYPGAIAATKVVNSYPLYKYGKTKLGSDKTLFNINVHEVSDFLKSSTDEYYSDENIATSTLLGTKLFDGTVKSTKITNNTGSSDIFNVDPSIRIPLNAAYFQSKIIDKAGSLDLKDAYNFIRYFKGVKVSVVENDGYLFAINPASANIIIYYQNDLVSGTVTTRVPQTFNLTMGTSLSSHVGQFSYNRTGTIVADALATINTNTGDKKLYPQGMGGPSVGFRIPPATIALLKNKVQNEKIGIISAKVRIYTDNSVWNNNYTKPSNFVFLKNGATSFLTEVSSLNAAPGFSLVKAYDTDKNPAYYDFTITTTLKEIVEKELANEDFIVHMGSFLVDSVGSLVRYSSTSRAFTPNRLVLVGTDATNPQRIQLHITYGSK